MTRIGFQNLVASSLDASNLNSTKLFDLQRQLSTGKKIANASEDPGIASSSQRINSKIRRDEQVIRSIDNNSQAIDQAETYMASTVDQLQRVRTLALQGANGTLITADMASIATEINQQLESLLQNANAKSSGKSLFAGAETDAPAFTAVRNAQGEITSVTYAGDDVELSIEAGGSVPISFPGDRLFGAGPTVRTSTAKTWNGSTRSNYADREVAAAFLPSSGVTEGSLRINDVLIGYDLDGSPTSAEGDSLNDLATKINQSNAGVSAKVTGVLQGTITRPLPITAFSAFAGFTAGSFTLNGQTVNVTGTDTLFTMANKINSSSTRTGVTAEIHDATGAFIDGTPALAGAVSPLSLRLSGGVEIGDNTAGNTNIMQLMGVTASPSQPLGSNLVGTVLQNYALQITSGSPGPFTISDASGSLAKDLGLTSSAAVTQGGTMFQTLIDMRDRLRAGDLTSIQNTILPQIDSALASVQVYRTEAGVRLNRLDSQKSRLEQVILNQKKILSDIEDVDLSEVISELRTQQTTQQAALKAVSETLGLSLLQFLR